MYILEVFFLLKEKFTIIKILKCCNDKWYFLNLSLRVPIFKTANINIICVVIVT